MFANHSNKIEQMMCKVLTKVREREQTDRQTEGGRESEKRIHKRQFNNVYNKKLYNNYLVMFDTVKLNALQNNKLLDRPKLKVFADDNSNAVQMMICFSVIS